MTTIATGAPPLAEYGPSALNVKPNNSPAWAPDGADTVLIGEGVVDFVQTILDHRHPVLSTAQSPLATADLNQVIQDR
jgi:hypothetical protein